MCYSSPATYGAVGGEATCWPHAQFCCCLATNRACNCAGLQTGSKRNDITMRISSELNQSGPKVWHAGQRSARWLTALNVLLIQAVLSLSLKLRFQQSWFVRSDKSLSAERIFRMAELNSKATKRCSDRSKWLKEVGYPGDSIHHGVWGDKAEIRPGCSIRKVFKFMKHLLYFRV